MRRGLETFSINKEDFDFGECLHYQFTPLELQMNYKEVHVFIFEGNALAFCVEGTCSEAVLQTRTLIPVHILTDSYSWH
jgi:hypothetical protein